MRKYYNNGVHDITNSAYHQSEGISRSMLMSIKRSPKHYWFEHLSGLKEKDEPTPAMILGNAVHTLVLEPSIWDSDFYTIKQSTKPRKGSNAYDEMIELADGRMIITPDENVQAHQMAASVLNDEVAKGLLFDCLIEQSIYFTHHATGLQCKVRPDAWFNNVIIDLKTSADASYKAFQSSCTNYGYFLQAAMIKQALASIDIIMSEFVFIVVEKSAPFAVAVYNLSGDALEYGCKLFDDLMTGLKYCIDNHTWAAYSIRELTTPVWVKYETELDV